MVTSRRALSCIERGKGICYQWKEKGQCSRGDLCSYGMRVTIVQDRHQKPCHPQTTKNSKTRGRSASRKGNCGGRSQSEKFNRQPCKYFLKGTCTKSPCEYWHLPECQFFLTKSGCKFGAECSFPHWEEQPNKKPKKGDDKSAVAIVKSA